MSKQAQLQQLTALVSLLESVGVEIDGILPHEDRSMFRDEELDVTIRAEFSFFEDLAAEDLEAVTLRRAELTDDGVLQCDIGFQADTDNIATGVPETVDATNGSRATSRTVGFDEESDGTVTPVSNAKPRITGCPTPATATPPHHDSEKLAAVYESCDTFKEMKEALGAEVTSETVRRQMIKHGIHEPDSASTPGSVGEEEAPDAADQDVEVTIPNDLEQEIDLPGDVGIEEFIDAVRDGNTILEISQRLEMDRDWTRRLIDDFGLMDLVMGRISAPPNQNVRRKEVIERLEHVAA